LARRSFTRSNANGGYMLTLVLILSILLQLSAAILAIRLIRITGMQLAWMLIASAVLLMAFRRLITLYNYLVGDISRLPNINAELIALLISVFMLVGIAAIKPLFVRLNNSKQKTKESEENLLAMAQNSIDGILVEVEGRHVFANRQAGNILGYAGTELLGFGMKDIVHPDEYERVYSIHSKQLKGENKPDIYETVYRSKDGEAVLVEMSDAVTTWNSRPAGIISFRDITERKRSEEKETSLGHILDNSLNEIYIFNADTLKFLQVNRGAIINLGYSLEEMLKLTPLDLKPGYTHTSFMRLLEPLYSGEMEKIRFETSHLRKDGSLYPVEVQLQLSTFELVPVFLATILDITERIQIEEEMKHYRENLEDQVKDRTKKLEYVNKELKSFSYSVSHDLRAPIRRIDGYSKILLEDYTNKLDDAGKKYLGRIRINTQRMGELIDDILMLSQVASREINKKFVNLTKLAHIKKSQLIESEPNRQTKFTIQDNLIGEGDAHLLEIVIENLFGNAWKFSSKREDACIEFGRTNKSNVQAYYIRDNGIGFDMKYANKLFNAFERLHSQDEFEGAGIGLATVRRIIQRHGGEIWVESEADKGATFYFTLGSNINTLYT